MSERETDNQINIVLGLGASGISAARLLRADGKKVTVIENNSNKKLKEIANTLKGEGIDVILTGKPLSFETFNPWLDKISSVIVSPGIDWEHITLKELRVININIKGEAELAWERLNHIPTVGITGTNGKTTVTNMINHILSYDDLNTDMGGNIGKPLSTIALEINKENHRKLNWLVLELSSYQIESSPNLNPNIGIWTTFTPDHLERHHDLENYFKIKRRLLEKSTLCIYNSDDQYLSEKRKELPEGIWIGINRQSSYSHPPKFWINDKGYIFENQSQLFHSSALKIPGNHNLQNLLLAIAAAREIGIDYKLIEKSITSFKPIPHRLECLGTKNNLTFYNDSKATNFDSSKIGLKSVPSPTILLAGGRQKDGDPVLWIKQIKQSTNGIVLFGSSANDLKQKIIRSSYEGKLVIKETLEEATIASIDIAQKTNSKTILLSPACASFDQYQNYEERGDHFKELIKQYLVSS